MKQNDGQERNNIKERKIYHPYQSSNRTVQNSSEILQQPQLHILIVYQQHSPS